VIQAPAERFIEVSREGWNNDVSICTFSADRRSTWPAHARLRKRSMTISQRAEVDGVACDVLCTGRFL
jgi:hypothetical protein